MSVNTALADLSQTASSNGPDGSVDPPSTVDDAIRYALSFIASLRDGKGFTTPVVLASAGTTDIGAQNSMGVEISGTTTITSFGTTYNGPRFLRFTGALTLTHNASTLILPGGANITTVAGDCAVVVPKTTAGTADGWNVVAYQRSSALPALSGANSNITSLTGITQGGYPALSVTPANLSQKLTLGTSQAASGTSVNFTSVPSWVTQITLSQSGVSTTGANQLFVQIGDSGGLETSGYLGGYTALAGTVATGIATTGFSAGNAGSSAAVYNGSMVLTLVDAATNTWSAEGSFFQSDAAQGHLSAGSKSLSGTLDRISLVCASSFDAGTVNILYQG